MTAHTQQVGHDFSRAAGTYDAHAPLQRDVLQEAVRLLAPCVPAAATVLDAGSGTGRLAEANAAWNIIGVDIAPQMCVQSRRRGEHSVCADIASLPLAAACADVALCSLVMQWLPDRTPAFAELLRVVKPGGHAVVAVFGAATLKELRAAFGHADALPHVHGFPSLAELLQEANSAGWCGVQQLTRSYKQQHASFGALLAGLKGIGATNKLAGRRRGLTPPSLLRHAGECYVEYCTSNGGVYSTWEVHYLLLQKMGKK